LLAPYYDLFINWVNRLESEIPFILKSCGKPRSGLRALDIGCGTGYHLRALQQAGFEVQGMEPSKALREQAVRNLPGTTVSPLKMERLPSFAGTHGPWDLVICLGNTLPHLPESLLRKFCRALYQALNQKGVAVIHLLGYEKILKNRPGKLPVKTIEVTEAVYRFERSYEYKKDHLAFNIEVFRDDILLGEDREILYPVTARKLRGVLSGAGFREIRLYGAFDHEVEYTPESDNLVAVLIKHPATAADPVMKEKSSRLARRKSKP